jgi:hypothetical protein
MLAEKFGIDVHGPLPEEPEGLGGEENAASDLKRLNHRWIQAFNNRDWQTESAVRSETSRASLSGVEEPLDNAAWSGFMAAFTTGFPDSRISMGHGGYPLDAYRHSSRDVSRDSGHRAHSKVSRGSNSTGWLAGDSSNTGPCSTVWLCYGRLAGRRYSTRVGECPFRGLRTPMNRRIAGGLSPTRKLARSAFLSMDACNDRCVAVPALTL